jgi:hypothetical protein
MREALAWTGLRWFIDGARLAQLARGNGISLPTTYRYLHEGITVLADHGPGSSSTRMTDPAMTPGTVPATSA